MPSHIGDQDIIHVAHTMMDSIKAAVTANIQKEGQKVLEVELYLKWLEGFEFVLSGIEVSYMYSEPAVNDSMPCRPS